MADLQGDADAAAIDDQVGAIAIAQRADQLERVGFVDIQRLSRADVGGYSQALLVDFCAEHDDLTGAAEFGHEERHHADGSGSLDDDGIARADDGRLLHQGVVGDANWLGQRGLLEGHVVGNMMQDRLTRADILGE